jgi:hypothetical protein
MRVSSNALENGVTASEPRLVSTPTQFSSYRHIMHPSQRLLSTIQISKSKQTWHQRQRRKKRGHRLVESTRTRCRTNH